MNIQFPLKEGDREKQKLCDEHHMELYKMLHHQLDEEQIEKKPKGAPQKYNDLDKFKFAVTAVKGDTRIFLDTVKI